MAGSFARRTLTIVLSLVLLGLVMSVHSMLPSEEDRVKPITASGEIGSTVDARQFTIAVDKVQFAEAVSDGNGAADSALKAKGIWVIVWAEVTATEKTLSHASARLDVGDLTYTSTSLLPNSLGNVSEGSGFDPDVTKYGAFAFEVPKKHLSSVTLEANIRSDNDDRLSARANVDLGLQGTELADRIDKAQDTVAIPPIETR